jgi:hypothetical protein
VRRRVLAMSIGGALALPAFWVELSGRLQPWWAEGLSLIAGATGAALFWTGLTGHKADWIPEKGEKSKDEREKGKG